MFSFTISAVEFSTLYGKFKMSPTVVFNVGLTIFINICPTLLFKKAITGYISKSESLLIIVGDPELYCASLFFILNPFFAEVIMFHVIPSLYQYLGLFNPPFDS